MSHESWVPQTTRPHGCSACRFSPRAAPLARSNNEGPPPRRVVLPTSLPAAGHALIRASLPAFTIGAFVDVNRCCTGLPALRSSGCHTKAFCTCVTGNSYSHFSIRKRDKHVRSRKEGPAASEARVPQRGLFFSLCARLLFRIGLGWHSVRHKRCRHAQRFRPCPGRSFLPSMRDRASSL